MKKLFFIVSISFNCFSQAAGSFDSTFNGNGKATYCFLDSGHGEFNSEFQSTGKIIIGLSNVNNTNNNGAELIRFNYDGSVDTTFGINGIQNFNNYSIFNNTGGTPVQLAIQADDKIIIMGLEQNNTFPNAYWIERCLPDGALDTGFNGTGYLELSFGTLQDRGYCVAIQQDGKILLGGNTGNTAEFMNVARLNTNGTLDTTFGVSGAAKVAFSTLESTPISIAVQPDGKIVLGGYTVTASAQDFALARFNGDGTLDTTFGVNGKVITTVDYTRSDRISKILLEPDGKIVAVGHTSDSDNPRMAMTRYLANGTLDTSFGNNGIMITADAWGRYPSMARQLDGKYVLAGGPSADIFEIYRYNHDGTIDSTFGTNGFVNPFPATGGGAFTTLIQPDNKIVVIGATLSPDLTQGCAVVVRLNPGVLSNKVFGSTASMVYPNPTKGSVFIDNRNNQYTKILVYNYLGQEIVKSFVLDDDKMVVDLVGLPNGVYFVKLLDNFGTNKMVKVIKE